MTEATIHPAVVSGHLLSSPLRTQTNLCISQADSLLSRATAIKSELGKMRDWAILADVGAEGEAGPGCSLHYWRYRF